jgi:hypothetical protein
MSFSLPDASHDQCAGEAIPAQLLDLAIPNGVAFTLAQ